MVGKSYTNEYKVTSGLKAGNTYYFKARGVVETGGKKYPWPFCNPLKVTMKK